MDPELIKDGALTDDGEALRDWLNQKVDELDGDTTPRWELRHWQMVVVKNELLTPVEFFTDYAAVSAALWSYYLSDLPDDDPRKALADADRDEGRHTRASDKAADKSESKKLVVGDVLTTSGRQLADLLERWVPDTDAGQQYLMRVHRAKLTTPAGFFRDFPEMTAELRRWSKTGARAAVAAEARERVAALRHSIEQLEAFEGKDAGKDGTAADLRAELDGLAEALGYRPRTQQAADAPTDTPATSAGAALQLVEKALNPW